MREARPVEPYDWVLRGGLARVLAPMPKIDPPLIRESQSNRK